MSQFTNVINFGFAFVKSVLELLNETCKDKVHFHDNTQKKNLQNIFNIADYSILRDKKIR
jgi:hypothetical protein